MYLELPENPEALPDGLGDFSQQLRQIASRLALNEDRHHEQLQVEQFHPLQQVQEGGLEGEPEILLLEDPLELLAHRSRCLVGDHLDARVEGVTGPDGPGEQVDGIGKLGLEATEPPGTDPHDH